MLTFCIKLCGNGSEFDNRRYSWVEHDNENNIDSNRHVDCNDTDDVDDEKDDLDVQQYLQDTKRYSWAQVFDSNYFKAGPNTTFGILAIIFDYPQWIDNIPPIASTTEHVLGIIHVTSLPIQNIIILSMLT